ncbi:MAG: hypothetical protein H6835_18580 [Planctomycetes bacterium]|nr:hypothetical protein [Planctomycetota bacterium]
MASALRSVHTRIAALTAVLTAVGPADAQQHGPAGERRPAAEARRPEHNPARPAAPAADATGRPDHNGAAARPTHDPQPTLPPLVAWQHVQAGNDTFVRHRRDDLPPPELPPRPSGAGRYVCAVVVCADFDGTVAQHLGLAAEDVLVLRVPGPFVTAESAALLERVVSRERVSLVLLLAHRRCESLRPPRDDERAPDAIDRRRETAVRDAERLGVPLRDALLRAQRELLLATSTPLQLATAEDRLRIVPGVVDDRTGAIDWRNRRSDELPLAPVK